MEVITISYEDISDVMPQYAIIAAASRRARRARCAAWAGALAPPPRPRAQARALEAVAIERLQNVLVPDGMGGHIQVEHLLLTGQGLRRHRCQVVRRHDLRQRAHGRVDRDRQARALHVPEPARHALRPRRRAAPARARRPRRGPRAVRAAARTSRRAGRATCFRPPSSSSAIAGRTRPTSSACSSRSRRIGTASKPPSSPLPDARAS